MTRQFIPLAFGLITAALPQHLNAQAAPVRAVIDPFPVRFTRGDSATVSVSLVDSIGGEVPGARWSLRTTGSLVRFRPVGSDGAPTAYVMAGEQPGSQLFYVAVSSTIDGKTTSKDIDSVTVTVADYPVTRIVIDDLAYHPYVGTTFRLTAKAYTDRGTERDARVIWRSDDPCHARVMPDGVITFAAAGKISVVARLEGVSAKKEITIVTNPVETVEISPKSAQARVGDLVTLRISATDRRGVSVDRVAFSFSVSAVDSAGGEIVGDGDFIAERPGTYVIRASAGNPTAEAVVEVGPRPPATAVAVVARAAMPLAATRALWVFTGKDGRDYAYVGTSNRTGAARVYVWDVTDPVHPGLSDSVSVSGAAVTDLQVNGDASWAVVGREPQPGGKGGLTVLDLARPGHPTIAAEHSDGVSGGIRGVWINGSSSLVYAADATSGGMVIFDLTDPRQPRFITGVDATSGRIAEIYDVWADSKHAFLAAGDGLIVLDVGDKGTPTVPRLLTTLSWKGGSARSVFRSSRYVYVAETAQSCDACVNGPRGHIRVINVQKPGEPREVASYAVPEAGAGAVWVENGVLYAAYHQGGLRIVDVSGELAHELYEQGRQAGWFMTGDRAMVVGIQLYKGSIYATDTGGTLWVLNHQRAVRLGS